MGISGGNPDGHRIQLIPAERIKPDYSFKKKDRETIDYYKAACPGGVLPTKKEQKKTEDTGTDSSLQSSSSLEKTTEITPKSGGKIETVKEAK